MSFDDFVDLIFGVLEGGLLTAIPCTIYVCFWFLFFITGIQDYIRSIIRMQSWFYFLFMLVTVTICGIWFVNTKVGEIMELNKMVYDAMGHPMQRIGFVIGSVVVFLILYGLNRSFSAVCPNCGTWAGKHIGADSGYTGNYKIEGSTISRERSTTYYYKCKKCGADFYN